jgi:hypothetical protein
MVGLQPSHRGGTHQYTLWNTGAVRKFRGGVRKLMGQCEALNHLYSIEHFNEAEVEQKYL